MKRYERLEAWHATHQLVLLTYRVTKSFPREELYALTSQARRAAFSAAASIAEGSAKKGPREFRRYLDIAVGSLSAHVAEWVKRAGPGVIVQASGGITLENARAYAEAGAALLAIGALTHSVSAAPITCEIVND